MAKGLVIPSIFTAVDKFSGPVSKMSKNTDAAFARMDRKLRKVGDTAFRVGRKSAGIGLAIAAPLGLLANEAVKFEDKMADVEKTTGLTGSSLIQFGEELRKLSTKTRTSIEDLQKIAQIGGQLGIEPDQLTAFTEAADKFNIAMGKDFGSVEEAVAQVGKLKNLFVKTRDLDISEVINKAGSAINFLGAEGSATSANMTDFALGLGALPDALKPSIQNTLALGAFLEELGIESKRGASGVTGLFLKAGADIDGFSKQMKISQIEAKNLLAQDPLEFAKRFSKTFKGLEPDVLAKKLAKLGLNSKEVIKVVGALGSSTQRMTDLQEMSNKSFSEGTSLADEAATKNATMAAKFAITKNKMQDLAITIGEALLPVISSLVEAVSPMIEKFASWVKNNKGTVATILKVAAVVAGLAFALSGISFVVGIASKAMLIFNAVMSANPIFLIIAGVALLGVALYKLSGAFSNVSAAEKVQNDVRQRALENSIDQRVEVDLLFRTLRRAEEGSNTYTTALAKLEKIQPGITKQFNLQTKSLDALNKAEDYAIGNIMKRADAEAEKQLLKEQVLETKRAQMEGPSWWEAATSLVFSGGAPSAIGEDFAAKIKGMEGRSGILAEMISKREFESISTKQTINETTATTKEKVEVVIKNETGNNVLVSGTSGANWFMPGLGNTSNL